MALDSGVVKIAQRQTQKYDANNALQDVVEITFKVDDDGPFVVDVPVSRYTPEIVEQMVGAVVANARATHNIFNGG